MPNRARRNPIGLPAPPSVQVVRVGSGEHTHVYHPAKQRVLCNSGKNAGRVGKYGDRRGGEQPLFAVNARFVTCYRCQKLAQMNLEAGRQAWQGPRD